MKLEDLKVNASVRGVLPNSLIQVVSVKWFGSDVVELTYKNPEGSLANELIYRNAESRLDVVEQGRPWSFGEPRDAASTKLGTTAGKRAAFRCLMSGEAVPYDHIRAEGKAGRMGSRLMAIVAEGSNGRTYLAPTKEMEEIALTAIRGWHRPGSRSNTSDDPSTYGHTSPLCGCAHRRTTGSCCYGLLSAFPDLYHGSPDTAQSRNFLES